MGIVVTSLETSVPWWNRFLEAEPIDRGTWLASEIGDYVGTLLGYPKCDISGAFWASPGGTVLSVRALTKRYRPGIV